MASPCAERDSVAGVQEIGFKVKVSKVKVNKQVNEVQT
jgi:hypothetical protein